MQKIISIIIALMLSLWAVSADLETTDIQRISTDNYQTFEEESSIDEIISKVQKEMEKEWTLGKFDWRIHIEDLQEWDAFLIWGKVIIDEKIQGDAYIFAWNAVINADIEGNLNIFSWNIELNSNVNKNVNIFAGETTISENSTINGKVWFFWWILNHKGEILWDLEIKAWEKTLDWTISWEVIEIKNLWTINKDFNLEEEKGILPYLEYIFEILSIFIITFALIFFAENKFDNLANIMIRRWWRSAFYSILFLLLIPVLSILLIVTIIGAPFGLILLSIYAIFLIFNKYIAVPAMFGLIKYKINRELKMYEKAWILALLSIVSILIPLLTFSFAVFVMWSILISIFHKD